MILTAAGRACASGASPLDAVPLLDQAQVCGVSSVSETEQVMTWQTPHATLEFGAGSRRLIHNTHLFWLNAAVEKRGTAWTIARVDAETIVRPLLQESGVLQHQGFSMVVLDPGHGGSDPGTLGPRRRHEKKLVLDICKRVRRKLNASNVAVRMTRRRDTALELRERPGFATRWGADVFVSLHVNSAGNTAANGIETFAMPAAGFASTTSNEADAKAYPGNRNDAANTLLARYLQRGILAQTQAADRGVKRARFAVLRDAACPAALVEVGFLSNPAEAAHLIDSAYRDRLAEGLAQGILTYLVKAEASQRP